MLKVVSPSVTRWMWFQPRTEFCDSLDFNSVFIGFTGGKAFEQLGPFSSYPVFHLKRRIMVHTVIDQRDYTVLEAKQSFYTSCFFTCPFI